MTISTLLDKKTILRRLTVTVAGVEIFEDDFITADFKYNLFGFTVSGFITIKDTYDLFNSGMATLGGDDEVVVSLTDFSGNKSKRTFKITKIESQPNNSRFETLTIYLTDVISFALGNTFLSKSFNDSPVAAMLACFSHIKLDSLIKADLLKQVINDTSLVDKFAIPQDVSLLEFFHERLAQDNIILYQDRYNIHAKKLDLNALSLKQDNSGKDILYSNNASNGQYLYLIHDFSNNKNKIGDVLSEYPTSKIFRFTTDKIILDVTKNTADVIDSLSLNGNKPTFPKTTGHKYNTQVITGTLPQEYDLFETLTHNNFLEITIPGDVKNANVGNLVDIELKGNISNHDSLLKGNMSSSGKYLVAKVSDRVICDKLIHKLTLIRVDSKMSR